MDLSRPLPASTFPGNFKFYRFRRERGGDNLENSFYHNLTEEELARVHEYNFDHPDAFDTDHLLSCMEKLRQGLAVDIPKYDFIKN